MEPTPKEKKTLKGLAGILFPSTVHIEEKVSLMLDVLQHRGDKDQRQILSLRNFEVGISGGKFAYNRKMSIITGIDGTIYNSDELSEELKQNGYFLKNSSFSEILLAGYELWETKIFEKIQGEFACMIIDQSREKIFLVRDRIGQKPLYWYQDHHHFVFSSELKSLLASSLVPQTPSLEALSSYLYLGFIPQDMSPVEKVSKLLPSHFLQLDFDGRITIQPYWSYSSCFSKQGSDDSKTFSKKVDSLLCSSVEKRLLNRERIGCFVSEELGSLAIAYTMKKNITDSESMYAFTTNFENRESNHLKATNTVCKNLSLDHKISTLQFDQFLDHLLEIVWHSDEPVSSPNIAIDWNLSKQAAPLVSKVFSGMGSEILSAGHLPPLTTQNGEKVPFFALKTFFRNLFHRLSYPLCYLYKPYAFKYLKSAKTFSTDPQYIMRQTLFDEGTMHKVSPRLAMLFDPEVFLNKFYRLSELPSKNASCLYYDIKTRLVDQHILHLERMTAGFGLDLSSPFLDKALIEYLASYTEIDVPTDGADSHLKQMLKNIAPPEVINQPKISTTHSLNHWLVDQKMIDLYRLLIDGTLTESSLISDDWVRKEIQNIKKNPFSARYLFAVLMLELWFRLFITGSPPSSPPDISVTDLLQG